MAWTTLDLNNLLAGEPLVEQEVLAFYENPIAIADGALGAPRNRPLSLNLMIGGGPFTLTAMTPVNFIDLDGIASLLIVGHATDGVATPTIQIGFSTNNGATWSAYQDLATSLDTSNGFLSSVHLPTGRVKMQPAITGAAGANAIRLRRSAGADTGRVCVYGIGRT
jgi:hypothetical protein